MDKFDDTLKQAQTIHEATEGFVEGTMQQITAKPERSRHWFTISLSIAGVLGALAIVFVLYPLGRHAATHSIKNATYAANVTNTRQATNPTVNSGSLPTGTDDASLASDLASIDSSTTHESTDQSGATNTLNDSSQQITIPTD